MSALLYLGIGAAALLGSYGVVVAMGRDNLDHLTPAGYDPAPPAEHEKPPIVVNPDREPW